MVREAVRNVLREVELFRPLDEEELAALSRQAVQRHIHRNELIFSQGDSGDGLYVIINGHVSIGRQNAEGEELILNILGPDEYFGELALFDDEPRSAGATAIEDSTVLFLSRAAFRRFMEAHPAALFTCLAVIVRQIRRLTDLADEIALLDVRSRLAKRLLHLAEQGMVQSNPAGDQASLRITQQQLANMLGATRESVNKHLNSLVDAGIIRLERGRIHILDRARLEDCGEGLV